MKTQKLISVVLSIVLLISGLSLGALSARVPTRSVEGATDAANPDATDVVNPEDTTGEANPSEEASDEANPSEEASDEANPSEEPSTEEANPSEEPSTEDANPSEEPSTEDANPSEEPTVPSTDKAPAIDTDKVKEINGIAYVAPELTAAEVIEAAGEGTKILKADRTELAADEIVGSGMILVKVDGTELTVVVMGDNNGDGVVAADDARFALRLAVLLEKNPTDWQKIASEVDEDKENISAADARGILRAAVKLDTLKLYY